MLKISMQQIVWHGNQANRELLALVSHQGMHFNPPDAQEVCREMCGQLPRASFLSYPVSLWLAVRTAKLWFQPTLSVQRGEKKRRHTSGFYSISNELTVNKLKLFERQKRKKKKTILSLYLLNLCLLQPPPHPFAILRNILFNAYFPHVWNFPESQSCRCLFFLLLFVFFWLQMNRKWKNPFWESSAPSMSS